MISQNAGEQKGKRKRRTKPKHRQFGDKKNLSSPKPNLVEMVSQNAAGASSEKKKSSLKPNLMDGRSAYEVTKRDLKSDKEMWALYERWSCYFKRRSTPDVMKKRFENFKNDANYIFEYNKKHRRHPLTLTRWPNRTPEERFRPPISTEELTKSEMEELDREWGFGTSAEIEDIKN